MKFKQLLALVLVCILGFSVLNGCSSGSTSDDNETTTTSDTQEGGSTAGITSSEGVTLTLYGNAADIQRPFMQSIFEMYQEETGNVLDIVGIDQDNFENAALIKFQTGDIPDLFMHFGGYGLDKFNPDENFVDFTDASWVADIEDKVVSQATREGKVYGLPFWEASVSGCIYNQVIFDDLGLSMPTTQEEFYDVCQSLLDAGIQPVYMAVKDQWPILYQYALDPIFADSDMIDKINSNQITYADIPEVMDMLEFYETMANKGYLGETYATDTWDYSIEVLGTGEAAMMFVWDTWMYTNYDSESYEYVADDFGLMPIFMGTAENGTFEGPNCSLMLANKANENVDAAIEFINYMADPDNYNRAFDGIKTAPCFKGQTTIETTPQYEAIVDLYNEVGNASNAYNEVIGFSQVEGAKYIQELIIGNIDKETCVQLLDEDRIKTATAQGVEGF